MQLVEHMENLPTETGRQPDIVVVGGDFNTNPDDLRFVSEKTLGVFKTAGFSNPLMDLPREQRVTIPGEGRYPAATFDHILIRGSRPNRANVVNSTVSDHRPVTVTLSVP